MGKIEAVIERASAAGIPGSQQVLFWAIRAEVESGPPFGKIDGFNRPTSRTTTERPGIRSTSR
jgi:hypothetical protein